MALIHSRSRVTKPADLGPEELNALTGWDFSDIKAIHTYANGCIILEHSEMFVEENDERDRYGFDTDGSWHSSATLEGAERLLLEWWASEVHQKLPPHIRL